MGVPDGNLEIVKPLLNSPIILFYIFFLCAMPLIGRVNYFFFRLENAGGGVRKCFCDFEKKSKILKEVFIARARLH